MMKKHMFFYWASDTRSWVSPKIRSEQAFKQRLQLNQGYSRTNKRLWTGAMTICFVQTMWLIHFEFLKALIAYGVLSTEVLCTVGPHMQSLV